MASTLRDDLASLKIERRESGMVERPRADVGRRRGGGGGGLGLLAWLLWLIPIGLLAVAGAYGYRQYEQFRSKIEVTTSVVQLMTSGEAEKLLSAKGYLKSRHQALIGAKIPGRVERMFVEEGSKVTKGQVLAVLEHNDLKAILAARQAQVAKTRAELQEAEFDLKQKEREALRASRLHAQRTSASQEEVERAHSTRDMTSARVAGLKASIKLMEANVAETEELIRNMSLYAPFDGTVVEKQGEEGEVITPSAMSASISRSAVVTLANLSLMDVETDVAENLMSRITIGQPAEISVSAVPSKHYRGRLRQIIPMGDRTRGTVKVKVEVLDPDEHLFPELVSTVHFLPDKALNNPNANRSFLFVPKSAVFDENGHSHVWVVDSKSRIHRRIVEVAVTNDDLARVESGLKSGETVVLSPPKTLHEDETVKVAD
jgi:RND family efflux transporter MFP subunit